MATLAGMRLCVTCGIPYDTRPFDEHGCRQACGCDRAGQERWPHGDFSERLRLCEACLATPLGSGSRWSPFLCDRAGGIPPTITCPEGATAS